WLEFRRVRVRSRMQSVTAGWYAPSECDDRVERPVGSLALLFQRVQPTPLGDEERYGFRDVADGFDMSPFVECVDVGRARPVGQRRHPSKVRVDPPIQVARCSEGLQWLADHVTL